MILINLKTSTGIFLDIIRINILTGSLSSKPKIKKLLFSQQ